MKLQNNWADIILWDQFPLQSKIIILISLCNLMKTTMYSPEQVHALASSIQQPPGDAFCTQHSFSCTQCAIFGCYRMAKASYKTYAIAYIFQLVMNTKKFRQNPQKQIPKFIFNYIRSVSLTAVDFMIMRRVLCLFHKYLGAKSESLIIANFLGGLYLAVQSRSRQIQITLYCINKTAQTVYNTIIRRHPNARIPHGQALLFAFSMAVMSYHYFNSKELFRPAYEKVFSTIFKDI